MKKPLLMLTLMFALSSVSLAQHCPFDGYYMLVAHLTDANNKPIENASFSLREIDNPRAESCDSARGLLDKSFLLARQAMNDYFDIGAIKHDAAERFCADCAFLGAGYYAVILTSAEINCKIYDRANNLSRYKRKYEIRYADQTLKVEETQIYRLCWAEGKWSRIKPIELGTNFRQTIKKSGKKSPRKSRQNNSPK